jgi:hypothetical protein
MEDGAVTVQVGESAGRGDQENSDRLEFAISEAGLRPHRAETEQIVGPKQSQQESSSTAMY